MRILRPSGLTSWHEPGFVLESDKPIDSIRARWTAIVDGARRPLPVDYTVRRMRSVAKHPKLYTTHVAMRTLRDPKVAEKAWASFERFFSDYCRREFAAGRACARAWARDHFFTVGLGVGTYEYDLEVRYKDGTIEVIRDQQLQIRPAFESRFNQESENHEFDFVGTWDAYDRLRVTGSTGGETWYAKVSRMPLPTDEDRLLWAIPEIAPSLVPLHYKATARVELETLGTDFQVGLMFVLDRPDPNVGNFPVGLAVWLYPDKTFSVDIRNPKGIWNLEHPRSRNEAIVSGSNHIQISRHPGFGAITVAINEQFVWCLKRTLDFFRLEEMSIAALYRSRSAINSAAFDQVQFSPHGLLIGGKYGWITEAGGNQFLRADDDTPFATGTSNYVELEEVHANHRAPPRDIALQSQDQSGLEIPRTHFALRLEDSTPELEACASVEVDERLPMVGEILDCPIFEPIVLPRGEAFFAQAIYLTPTPDVDGTSDPAAIELHSEAKALYYSANAKYRKNKVREFNFISIKSGYRSVVEQAEYFEAFIRAQYEGGSANPADKPGVSTHNYGVAIDIVRGTDRNIPKAMEVAKWRITHSNEPWHYDAVGIASWPDIRDKILALKPSADKYAELIVGIYEARKRVKELHSGLETEKERLQREKIRLDNEKSRLELARATLESRQSELARRKNAISVEGAALDKLRREIDGARYDLCPNGQPFELCDHEDAKAQWVAELNRKVREYNDRNARLRSETDLFRRDSTLYNRDREAFLGSLSDYHEDQGRFVQDNQAFAKRIKQLSRLEDDIADSRSKSKALIGEIAKLVGPVRS